MISPVPLDFVKLRFPLKKTPLSYTEIEGAYFKQEGRRYPFAVDGSETPARPGQEYMTAAARHNAVHPGSVPEEARNIGKGSARIEEDAVSPFPGGLDFPEVVLKRPLFPANQGFIYVQENSP
jgi:hypothetical protein